MSKSILDLMFDFSVPWFWITFVITIFLFLLWIFLIHEFRSINSDDITSPVLALTIYLVTLALYAAVYIQSLKKEPAFDFGFYISVFIGTVLFYLSILFTIIFLIRSMIKIKSTNQFLKNLMISLFFFVAWISSYSLAYSSPSGILLSIFQLIVCMWQTKFIGKNNESNKQKKD